jgi:nucleoid DNA-binding protein
VKVPARLVVSFKAGKKMAQRVRKSKKVPGQ